MTIDQYKGSRPRRIVTVFLGLFALGVILGFAALGNWQSRRADYKERLLAALAAADRQAPSDLAAVIAGQADPPERVDLADAGSAVAALPLRVHTTLTLDPDSVVWLDNQVLDGQAGVEAYGVAETVPPTRPLLVDLGWWPLPSDRRLPTLAATAFAPRTLELALLNSAPRAGLRMGVAAAPRHAATLVNYLDIAALRASLDPRLLNAVLLLPATETPGRHRDPTDTISTMPPSRHRGYAVQWYALAAAAAVVTLLLFFRKRA